MHESINVNCVIHLNKNIYYDCIEYVFPTPCFQISYMTSLTQ